MSLPLSRLAQCELGRDSSARGAEVRYLQYVTRPGGLVERQGELVSAEEIPPVIIVREWIG